MKRTQLVLNILLVSGMLTMGSYMYFKSDKAAYIDNAKLFEGYKGMKDARAEIEKKAAQWKANTDTLISEFQQELKVYEKERNQMSAKERELKEQLLRNKQLQINQYQEAVKEKSIDDERILTQTAVNAINDYIQEYGKKQKYKLILGATGQGNILYGRKGDDITQQIVDGLNKEYELDHPSKR